MSNAVHYHCCRDGGQVCCTAGDDSQGNIRFVFSQILRINMTHRWIVQFRNASI